MRHYARLLREGIGSVLRRHPVEALLAVYGCVGCLLTYENDWNHALPKFSLAALFFVVALAVNNLAWRGAWRKIYWVCWVPILPLTLWPGLEAWTDSESARITFGVLLPLVLLSSRLAVRNERFVCDGIVYLRSGVLALLFANVALGLFCAILYSTTYIFGLEGQWIERMAVYAVTFSETVGVPLLFLIMCDRWRGAQCVGNRVVEVLLNYIVTPALMIYAAILYLYMVRILVTWTLPEGGVAYLVFGFTIFSLLVAALQILLEKRIYDRFFNRIGWLLLPAQGLFWIGVLRRIDEYGLTEPRVYLIVCGALMTLCVVLFLSRRTGRYFYVALAALCSFAALAYVPSLEPERVAVRSQMHRAVRIARSLGRLDASGHLLLTPVQPADTVRRREFRSLYEALDYIRRDSAAFAPFGIESPDDYAALFPEAMRAYVESGYDAAYVRAYARERNISVTMPNNASFDAAGSYSRFYTNLGYWNDGYGFRNDTLRLMLGGDTPVLELSAKELLERQLAASGFDPALWIEATDEQTLKLLDYRDERCRIVFDRLHIRVSDTSVELSDLSINCLWMR